MYLILDCELIKIFLSVFLCFSLNKVIVIKMLELLKYVLQKHTLSQLLGKGSNRKTEKIETQLFD